MITYLSLKEGDRIAIYTAMAEVPKYWTYFDGGIAENDEGELRDVSTLQFTRLEDGDFHWYEANVGELQCRY